MKDDHSGAPRTQPIQSATFSQSVNAEIRRAAATGIYDIRGGGAKRKVPHFDDLLFLGASISRYPLEGYREACDTSVTLGTRHAKTPIQLDIPITIAGMSFGALSGAAKEALGRGATLAGTSTTTGDGGMTPEERGHSKTLVYQYLPSRYGMNPDDLRKADAIEVVVGQGAKPGGGGMLLGQKITDRVAEMRNLPKGIDQRSACRHPDWTGPDDLEIKILEIREITGWRAALFRHHAGGQGGGGCGRARRDAGRHGGDAGRFHRTCRHADPRLYPRGRARAGRPWHAPRGATHRVGRHPQRGGCRQVHGAWGGCSLDRHGGADRAWRQRSEMGRRVPQARHHRRRL
jgi:hypothetical protein